MTKQGQHGLDTRFLLETFARAIDARLVDRGLNPQSVDPSVRLVLANELYWERYGEELEAVMSAQDGKHGPLLKFIRARGAFGTDYGRDVLAKIVGDERQSGGQKRTRQQIGREAMLAIRVAEIMHQQNCHQAAAIRRYMDENPNETQSPETVRTQFNRGRNELLKMLEVFGLTLGPKLKNAFQKTRSSETD